ncbi:MAG: ABC transporter permease [Ardenticatenaceae bacterium]|nr:ABC transporter permease [Anaerolineales bacterium]MCB8923713.1 ABC transporter permease [Ardenticatenaceae bacterium]
MNEDLTTAAILLGIIHSGIRLATPYLYAAIGETFSQRSGVLNLGVDGIMLMGAFFGFYTVFQTHNPWLGLLAAGLVGAVMALILCVVSITYQAEQGISGIGLYMFGLGMSSLLFKTMLGTVEGVKGFSELRFCFGDSFCLADVPVLGDIFFSHSLVTYGAFALVPLAWWILNRTTWGLKIRAVGQNPEAADSLGVSVNRVRYASVTVGGVLAGLAGASLSISLLNIYQENMTNGMGFIAVALVYFGSWKPGGVLLGALLFSTVNALQLWVQVLNLNIPSDVAVMLPYLLTILALALPFRRALQPAALTKPFARGEN